MEQYNRSLGELNAVEYLHEFIETYLALTFKEEQFFNASNINEKLDKFYFENNLIPNQKKHLKKLGFKVCNACKKRLELDEFYSNMCVCKNCYNKQRKLKRKAKLKNSKNRQKKRFCKECLQIKPVQEFYGRDFICKQCKARW